MDLELFNEVVSNVDWRERWLWGLAGFHTTTFASILITRGRPYIQALIFCLLALLCFSSEYINEWAAENYSLFAGEQYFDASGFFIFVVFAAPIILNCLAILFLWMWEAWRAMGDLGQARVRQQLRRKRDSTSKKNK